ncbi:MAG: hypothetical protein SVU88_05055 [Candidatus Nanohaloarchaea archaeon]|nr:hypothetical protein [Candidatus Nanohaloarchaea archaeon]
MRPLPLLALGILMALSGCLHPGMDGEVGDGASSATFAAEYTISITGLQNYTRSVIVTDGQVRTVSDSPGTGEELVRYRPASIDGRYLACSSDSCDVVAEPFPPPSPSPLFTGQLADAVEWRPAGTATVAGADCQRFRATAQPVTDAIADQITPAGGLDGYDTVNLTACVRPNSMIGRFSASAGDRYRERRRITAVLRSASTSVERPLTPPVPATASIDCDQNTGNVTVLTSHDTVTVQVFDVTRERVRTVENLTVPVTAPWRPSEFTPDTALASGNGVVPVVGGTPVWRGSAVCRGTRQLLSRSD